MCSLQYYDLLNLNSVNEWNCKELDGLNGIHASAAENKVECDYDEAKLMNTLLYENEMENAIAYARFLYEHGVDALIIQAITQPFA